MEPQRARCLASAEDAEGGDSGRLCQRRAGLIDWPTLNGIAEIKVFRKHLSKDQAVDTLQPFDVLCTIREGAELSRRLFARFPNQKLVTIIGASPPYLDMDAATEYGVLIVHPDDDQHGGAHRMEADDYRPSDAPTRRPNLHG